MICYFTLVCLYCMCKTRCSKVNVNRSDEQTLTAYSFRALSSIFVALSLIRRLSFSQKAVFYFARLFQLLKRITLLSEVQRKSINLSFLGRRKRSLGEYLSQKTNMMCSYCEILKQTIKSMSSF